MEYKDYAELYSDSGEAFIEIILEEKNEQKALKKIKIWNYDFEDILDEIPLNEDGMYVALAYHQHIDFPWQKLKPNPWEMDNLEISLSQLEYVRDNLSEDSLIHICNDMCDILEEAIGGKHKVFIRYFYM